MREEHLLQQLRESERCYEALTQELASERASRVSAQQELAALRHDFDALIAATRVVTDDRDAFQRRMVELESINGRLVDMLWGRRSERRPLESPTQMSLPFSEEPPLEAERHVIMAQAQQDEASDQELLERLKTRRKARQAKRGRREEFPESIERRVLRLDLPEEQKKGLTPIGVKTTERMRFEKPHAYVEVIERPQYVVAGKPEEGVRSVPPPLSIVEGCKYDFSVIAAIAAMKFGFHMPTYRQQDWYGQCGWFPSRSTVNELINYAVATIVPLHEQMWQLLLAQSIVLGDDTRVLLLLRNAINEQDLGSLDQRNGFRRLPDHPSSPNSGRTGSAASYAWLYTGLDTLAPYNVFHWSLTHQNSVIDGHLATYQGIFVGDACGANARLEERSGGRIVHASCNAHARREFVNAEKNDPILASQMISFYCQLYEVEERGTTRDADARYALRQRDAVPVWNRMRRWLDSEPVSRVLPQSDIGKAVGYLRNHWSALQVYLSDGRIPIDNDQSEQTIRPLTVGRGNWLFLGHPNAAPGRMQLFSIVSSAHRHHLELYDYLEDVLRKLADAKQNHPTDLQLGSPYLLDLLPDCWASAHPQSVRTGRAEENEMVSDAKRYRRTLARIADRAAQAQSS
jgi:transposase